MLKDLTPSELRQQGCDFLSDADDARPESLKVEKCEALVAYLGEYAEEGSKYDDYLPECDTQIKVNRLFGDVNSLVPYVLARNPKPSYRGRKPGKQLLADCFAKIKEHTDKKFDLRAESRCALFDNLILCCGYLRHDKHPESGIARSLHFPAANVWWDSAAKSPKKAKWMIEKHCRQRWEMRKQFGAIADKLPPDKAHTDVSMEKRTNDDRKSDFDEITYYMLWSKIDDENRVYAFHKSYGEQYLNTDERGRPGKPFPYVFDDDEWHLSQISIYPVNHNPYGMSYWDAGRAVMRYLNVAASASLQATLNAAKTATLIDQSVFPDWQKVLESRDLNPILTCNLKDAQMQGGIEAFIKHIPAGASPTILKEAMALANGMLNDITGIASITLGNPQSTETAAEAVRLGEASANRIADPQAMIEEWLNSAAYKEAQINAKELPRRTTICWYPAGYSKEEEESPDGGVEAEEKEETTELGRKVDAGGDMIKDIPYEEAVLLEAGVGDPQAADDALDSKKYHEEQSEFLLALGQGIESPPPELMPEVALREKYGIPNDAEVVIYQPGADSIVGEELAQAWSEKLTPRQIRDQVDFAIEVGSTSRTGNVMKSQTAMQAFNALGAVYLSLGLYDEWAALCNATISSFEQEQFEDAKVSGEKVRMAQQNMMNMQAKAQADAQAQKEQEKQAAGEQQIQLNQQEMAMNEQDQHLQVMKNEKEVISLERDKVRDRSKGFTQAVAGAVGV